MRSRNAPAADVAEILVAVAYDGLLAAPSEKSWDVRAGDGRALQVKCRMVDPARRPGNYSVFRSFAFDACVFVTLDARTGSLVRGVEVPADALEGVARRAGWVNGFRVHGATPLLGLAGAVDVSDRLAHAAARVLDTTARVTLPMSSSGPPDHDRGAQVPPLPRA